MGRRNGTFGLPGYTTGYNKKAPDVKRLRTRSIGHRYMLLVERLSLSICRQAYRSATRVVLIPSNVVPKNIRNIRFMGEQCLMVRREWSSYRNIIIYTGS